MRTTVLKITSDREAKKETLRQLRNELIDEIDNEDIQREKNK